MRVSWTISFLACSDRKLSMSQTASALVQKVWNYAHVLKDDGLAFMDYTEQITFLLFLKMTHEGEQYGRATEIPEAYF